MIAVESQRFNPELWRMQDAYVAFGSNLGDREANLCAGFAGLLRCGLHAARVSSVWETEPVDAPGPEWFLNLVARIETDLAPLEILDLLLAVEQEAGRVRGAPNAQRTLDLDLLLVGEVRCRGPRLVLPHPRMWQRRFVVEPLFEIAPELRDPSSGRSVREIRRALPDGALVRRVGRLDRSGIPPGL